MKTDEQPIRFAESNPKSVLKDADEVRWRKRRRLMFDALVSCACISPIVVVTLMSVSISSGNHQKKHCKNNLEQIGLALSNYHDAWGSFPPSYTADSRGTRLHSWRTLLLPYLGYQQLYEKINLTKPWNDPVNQFAIKEYVSPYNCPSSRLSRTKTQYLAIVSEESCFPPQRSISRAEILDGAVNTMMVVEVPGDLSVDWMSPQDIDELFVLNMGSAVSFNHSDGFHALTADGKVRLASAKYVSGWHFVVTRDGRDNICDSF